MPPRKRPPAGPGVALEAVLTAAVAADPASPLARAWAADPAAVWRSAVRTALRSRPPRLPEAAWADLPGDRAPPEVEAAVGGVLTGGERGAYEALAAHVPAFDPELSARSRRARGLFYTPAALAERLAGVTLDGLGPGARVLDPACGDGALLVAAGRTLVAAGADPAAVGERQLWGVDLDPVAVEEARRALRDALGAWSARVRWGDALLGAPADAPLLRAAGMADAWSAGFLGSVAGRGLVHAALAFAEVGVGEPSGGFDAVLANPPFLTQLGEATALGRAEAALVRAALPGVVGAYTDVAALFAARAWAWVRPGGRMGVVLPEAVLAARDGAGLRALLAREGRLVDLWLARGPVFADAGVRVCTVVVEKTAPRPSPVTRAWGLPARAVPALSLDPSPLADGRPWSPLLAALRGLPPLPPLPGPPLSTRAEVAADFRDEYYGLVGRVHEAEALEPDAPRLLVTRLVGPGVDLWGRAPVRFGKAPFRRPAVDLDALEPAIRAWAERRRAPKLVVATQTRVLEAVADRAGRCLPVTPLLTVTAPAEALSALLAVLLSPVASLWALTEHGGVALADDMIKLSAAHLRQLPLPTGAAPWARAAARLDATAGDPAATWEALPAVAADMVEAYGADPALVDWWRERLGTEPPA